MATQSEALEKTIKFCGIRLGDLAEKASISRSYLTEIRTASANPTIDVIEKLLAAMEDKKPGCRRYFYATCAGDVPATPEEHVSQMDKMQAGAYMRAIAAKYFGGKENPSNSTDETRQLVTIPS